MIAAVIGLASMFASGLFFDVFGQPITFQTIGAYAFYCSIWFAVFGVFWCLFSAWTAFRMTVGVMAVFLGLFIAGKLSRGEL